MKKICLLLAAFIACLVVTSCGNNSELKSANTEATTTEKTEATIVTEESEATVVTEDTEVELIESEDYDTLIKYPDSNITCDYYSYGTFYSSTEIHDFSYSVKEQSSTQLRIDFKFNCTLVKMGDNASGSSINFYINAYDKDGNKVKNSIVNDQLAVGETKDVSYTFLIDKNIVSNGVSLKFEGNN